MSTDTRRANGSPATLSYTNPATGEALDELTCHSLEDVDRSLEGLRQAAVTYGSSPVRERVRLVRRFRQGLAANVDALVETICAETGKKRPDAILEIFAALELLRTAAKLAPRVLRRSYRPSGALVHKRGYVDYRPHGVAAIISPWNYPLVTVAAPAGEALLAGNTVALKPSEHTSHTALLIKDIFTQSTGRSELLEVMLGYGDVGERLVTSPLSDVVCFTGSTSTGKAIARTCAGMLKPVILELGGKDAMIVLADANLKRAAKSAVWGGFTNAGQTCIAVERIYVEQAVYEPFLDLLREEARRLTTGSKPGDAIGPVTIKLQYEKIEEHRRDAQAKGATVESFGEADGRHISPFLVTNADHSMSIIQDETFGPELAVIAVADEQEAVRQANDSRFGLSAYIFTGNARRGRRIARQLATGTAVINDVIVQYGFASLPFGGFGDSGLGKLHGREGLLSFSRQQAVVEGRVDLPLEIWWFDFSQKTYGLMRRFVRFWYG